MLHLPSPTGGDEGAFSSEPLPYVNRFAATTEERIAQVESDLAYWRGVLSGEQGTLQLPADRARPLGQSTVSGRVAVTVMPHIVSGIECLGASFGVNPFLTFFAAYFAFLHRSTGQSDLLVGTSVARDGRCDEEVPDGVFVKTLPVRVRIAREDTFGTLLMKVHTSTSEMLAHTDIAFDGLELAQSTDGAELRKPIFNVCFDYEEPRTATSTSEVEVRRTTIDLDTSALDLALVLRGGPDGTLGCEFDYNSDAFERSTIDVLASHFLTFLESLIESEQVPIARLALASAAELETIVNVWSRPDPLAPIPAPGGELRTIPELVAFNAMRRPDATALIEDSGKALTYAELDRHANRLAHALRARGVGRNVCVGLYLERSVSAVVAMLATLKAGGAYVPLDPVYPSERIAYMLGRSNVETIITRRELFGSLEAYEPMLFDFDDPALGVHDAEHPPAADSDPDSLAYVIFTSGSTGKPKAVGVAQRGVVALVTRTPLLALGPYETALLQATLAFDASVVMIWRTLVYGARLAIMPAGPFSLAEFETQLTRYSVSALHLSTTLFHQLVQERIDAFKAVRSCIVGGDVLSPAHSARFARQLPNCRLFNAYGPTEITIDATFHEVLADAVERRSVPIGRPAAEARLYIVDEFGLPVPIGVAGELWIGGSGVAHGYLNDPELTERRFVSDPFSDSPGARAYRSGDFARWLPNGKIEFIGRADGQVKIRGFRVELSEIEFALLEHPMVRHAAVVMRGDTDVERRIIAYAEARDGECTEDVLLSFLATQLPPYAMPARLMLLESLPKTASGKLDRLALPEVPARAGQTDAAAPAVDDLQLQLIQLWETLLGVHPIGIRDDFFALGGHSLLAVMLISEIERQFGVRLPLAVLFEKPTIEKFAEYLQHEPANVKSSAVVMLNAEGTSTPLFFLHGMLVPGGGVYCLALAKHLGPDRPLFAMRPQGVDDDAIPPTIEAIAEENIVVLKTLIPEGPYLLGGFCSAGIVAFEMARQLVAQGDLVDNVILISTPHAGRPLRHVVELLEHVGRVAGVPAEALASFSSTLSRIAYHLADYSCSPDKREYLRLSAAKARMALSPSRLRARSESLSRPDAQGLLYVWGWLNKGYVPRRYLGRLTVLMSKEESYGASYAQGWSTVSPRVNVSWIPGKHLTCLTDYIGETANKIAAEL